jgi:glucose/arabinose dehydrogenase
VGQRRTRCWATAVEGLEATSALERPADIAFAPDGRMFFADDNGGGVVWMAPTTLLGPAATD